MPAMVVKHSTANYNLLIIGELHWRHAYFLNCLMIAATIQMARVNFRQVLRLPIGMQFKT